MAEQPYPNLTLRDLAELLGAELEDIESGVTLGADHADALRVVYDRLAWLVRIA